MAWFWLRRRKLDATELDSADLRVLLEAEIREATGMSLAEFMRALEAGELDPESPNVAGLAILTGARSG